MTADVELITRKLLLIAADLDALRGSADRGLDAYLAGRTEQLASERLLERIVGRMIDVNYHLLTTAGQPPPPDYHASFTRLAELGVLDAAFAHAVSRAAGLRNRLVHDYEEIDHAKVFEAIQSALHDVPHYLAAVRRYVPPVQR